MDKWERYSQVHAETSVAAVPRVCCVPDRPGPVLSEYIIVVVDRCWSDVLSVNKYWLNIRRDTLMPGDMDE
jgi:hypothetical protein